MINQAEARREFQGMTLSQHCPSVSHLLFADDSLFFCKATTQDSMRMAQILKDYEELSGQKVNLLKSSDIFGMRIPYSRKQHIQSVLGIYNVGGGGKYLGLPEQFGQSKTEAFQSIVDGVKKTVGGWYNQFLTAAGKETLIKSIAQAKPVYSMNCFLLPKQTCEKVDSILSEFWWGTNEHGRRKISWISWKRLALPKSEGGMGFKDLHCFNKALLAKQAWRLLINPSSLLARLYRGRYHRSSTFLESVGGRNPSYGWKSIQAGKSLLKKGLQVRLGDGEDTSVWDDNWLPVLPPRVVQQQGHRREMKVKDLWKPGIREWDEDKLAALLDLEDARLAKTIRLSRYAQKDEYVWPYTVDGVYTVKSGYWTATHIIPHEDQIEPPPGSYTQTCIMEDKDSAKTPTFLLEAQSVWRCANFVTLDGQGTLEENIRKLMSFTEIEDLSYEVTQPQEDARRGLQAAMEWLEANPEKHITERQRHATIQWEPPPEGILKCNFDSSFSRDSDSMAVGWIVRNHTGMFMEAGWTKLPQVDSPLQAEACGFLYVVQRIWCKGWRNVWFEGDNLELTNIINQQKKSMELVISFVILTFGFGSYHYAHLATSTGKKPSSRCLAKAYLRSQNSCMFLSSPPVWLRKYLYFPFTL
ncbi:unnamed protein product [Microthlaspi erraticum]|uniref:RNase H type-1 domain-containing protein n=1 Tax=Microthlaspi erraticum TaxID=1685480 RepID=A0A6D2JPD6_9BRAS|nr:unnamed protein product [Microthlaspi erraticum]